MAPSQRSGLGIPQHLALRAPAVCVGHPLHQNPSCTASASVTLWGLVENDHGGPMAVLVTVCPKHSRAVEHYLQGMNPDFIERWATSTFFEKSKLFEDSGIEWNRLMRIA